MLPNENLYPHIVASLRRFFDQCGVGDAVLGVSGGIDSALVLCMAVDALGADHVHGLMMPGPYSTVHSLADAIRLCENNNVAYHTLPIDGLYNKALRLLNPLFGHAPHDVTEENVQSRLRCLLLMAYSNKKKALVLNTTNKSELAMGYGTLYGDLGGALMPIADLYKKQIYALAHALNGPSERIPESILTKEPSAELRAGQKDSDTLPPYPVLDPLLEQLIEQQRSATDLLADGAPADVVKQVTARMGTASFKLLQCPPVLQVTDHPLLAPFKCIDIR